VNATIDAAYLSMANKQWQPIELPIWRGEPSAENASTLREFDADHYLLKEERMPDGTTKLIVRHKETGRVENRIKPG
jgi:hypothetical protein